MMSFPSEPDSSQSDGTDSQGLSQSSTASILSSEKQVKNGESHTQQSPSDFTISPPLNDAGNFISTAIVVKNIPFAMKKQHLQIIMKNMGLRLPSPFNYHFENGYFKGVAYGSFKTGEDANLVVEKMNYMKILGQELRVEHETIFSVLERENIQAQNQKRGGGFRRQQSITERETYACTMSSSSQFHNGEPSNPAKQKQTRSASISSDLYFESAKPPNAVYQKGKSFAPNEDPNGYTLRGNAQKSPLEDLPSEERPIPTWKPAQEILDNEPNYPCIDGKGKSKFDERKVDDPLDQVQLPASPEKLLTAEEREFIKASEENGERPLPKEFLDFGELARVRMYNYYVSHLDAVKSICGDAQGIKGSPAQNSDDLALLKTMTRHHGSRRLWMILINDLACEECVIQLRDRRKKPEFNYRRFWHGIQDQIKRICSCQDYDHDFVCTHRNSSRLDRLFRALGRRNTTRISNVELKTERWASVDPELLASAVHNLEFYVTNLRSLSIQFHFCKGVPVKPDLVKRIVCSLARMESLLPWRQRLMVYGFEAHEECQIAWAEKSRKWYE